MFDCLRTQRIRARLSAQRVIGAVALALMSALVMSFVAGEAQACSPGASIAAIISHKLSSKSVLKPNAVILSKVMMTAKAPTLKSDSVRVVGSCCGGSLGFGCPQSGCAFCAMAVFDPAPGMFTDKTISDYVLARGDDVPSASLDPHFRPPCLA